MFLETDFFHPTRMIEPKTEAGKTLRQKYEQKVSLIEHDLGTYPRTGPLSKAHMKNKLHLEYNEALCEIETVFQEELSEASRPQMNEPTTVPGRLLRDVFNMKILTATEAPSSPNIDIDEVVNGLREKYNEVLLIIEEN